MGYVDKNPQNVLRNTENSPDYFNDLAILDCDSYLIDFNASTNTIKHWVAEYFEKNRAWSQ